MNWEKVAHVLDADAIHWSSSRTDEGLIVAAILLAIAHALKEGIKKPGLEG
jgi:hypothetical protein